MKKDTVLLESRTDTRKISAHQIDLTPQGATLQFTKRTGDFHRGRQQFLHITPERQINAAFERQPTHDGHKNGRETGCEHEQADNARMKSGSGLTGAAGTQQAQPLADDEENQNENQNAIGDEQAVHHFARDDNRNDTGENDKGG